MASGGRVNGCVPYTEEKEACLKNRPAQMPG
jgi:hypothetical protein